MGDLKDLTVEGFVDVTASDAPAPGGGSVSALAGALAAALAEMVANLTVGKAKYAEVGAGSSRSRYQKRAGRRYPERQHILQPLHGRYRNA